MLLWYAFKFENVAVMWTKCVNQRGKCLHNGFRALSVQIKMRYYANRLTAKFENFQNSKIRVKLESRSSQRDNAAFTLISVFLTPITQNKFIAWFLNLTRFTFLISTNLITKNFVMAWVWWLCFLLVVQRLASNFIPRKSKKSQSWQSNFKFWICIKNNACMRNWSAWMHV